MDRLAIKQLLKITVASHPDNLTECFERVSLVAGYTYKTIMHMWYMEARYETNCFKLPGCKPNVKNRIRRKLT